MTEILGSRIRICELEGEVVALGYNTSGEPVVTLLTDDRQFLGSYILGATLGHELIETEDERFQRKMRELEAHRYAEMMKK